MQYLYLIKCQQFYKIGVTKNVKDRMHNLQTGNPYPLELIAEYGVNGNIRLLESLLHTQLKGKNVLREWFELDEHELSLLKETCEMLVFNKKEQLNEIVEKWREYKRGMLQTANRIARLAAQEPK